MVGQRTMLKKILLMKRNWENTRRILKLTGVLFVCELYLIDNPQIIGVLNDDMTCEVVEIDESKFFPRKYHRGQWRAGHWVSLRNGGSEEGTTIPKKKSQHYIQRLYPVVTPSQLMLITIKKSKHL
jgi:hypothetical protein